MIYTAGTIEGDSIELVDVMGKKIVAHSYDDSTEEAEIIICNTEGRFIVIEGPNGNEILKVKVKVPGAQIRLKKSRSGAI